MSSDLTIQPVGVNFKVADKNAGRPIYLISLETSVKKNSSFIAVKLTKEVSFIEVVGFYGSLNAEESVPDMVSSVAPEKFVEMMFPWNKINSIRNLVYTKVRK